MTSCDVSYALHDDDGGDDVGEDHAAVLLNSL